VSRISVRCPQCNSDDLHGQSRVDDTIELTCGACGHSWDRVPSIVCPRCASTDVIDDPWEDWRWDDREAGTWSFTEETDHRCRKCDKTWHSTRRTEPGDDFPTKEDLGSWTIAELREEAVDLGLVIAGLRKPDLIKAVLRDYEKDYYSEEQLTRMPRRALNAVARVFGVSVRGHTTAYVVAAVAGGPAVG